MKHAVSLALGLAIFWLINSGHFDQMLLGLGLLSVLVVVVIAQRMEVVDQECPPVQFSTRLPFYFLWLSWEIIKSNIDVVKLIWQRSPDISPTVFTVQASQQSDVGKVIYANSITMTPGTVTLDIKGDVFEVHALTKSAAEDLQQGHMDRQVKKLEGQCS